MLGNVGVDEILLLDQYGAQFLISTPETNDLYRVYKPNQLLDLLRDSEEYPNSGPLHRGWLKSYILESIPGVWFIDRLFQSPD